MWHCLKAINFLVFGWKVFSHLPRIERYTSLSRIRTQRRNNGVERIMLHRRFGIRMERHVCSVCCVLRCVLQIIATAQTGYCLECVRVCMRCVLHILRQCCANHNAYDEISTHARRQQEISKWDILRGAQAASPPHRSRQHNFIPFAGNMREMVLRPQHLNNVDAK